MIALLRKYCVLLSLVLLLVACSKLTQENFDKVQPGMSMAQVVSILGEPTESQSINIVGVSGSSATWRDQQTEINIQFLDNKVQIKTLNKINNSAASVANNS